MYVFKELVTLKFASTADPEAIGAELAGIAATGGLTPLAVVDAARKPTSAMHKLFDWNDEIAAEKWRLVQARSVIRHIHIVDDDQEVRPAFLSVNIGETKYEPIQNVMKSRDMQAAVLAAAKRDLDAYMMRYKSLKEICELVQPAKRKLENMLDARE